MLQKYPLVSAVIANYNRCDDLRKALMSLRMQDYPYLEIIVVDNASQDDSRLMLMREFPEVSIVALNENIGMDGYSVGFRQAKGELMFQMDNDSLLPDSHVVSEVVKRFQEGPSNLVGVATRVEECSGNDNSVDNIRRRDLRRGPVNTGGYHAGGVGFKKILLDEVGYYSRDIFLYGSEIYLTMKCLAKGYKIIYYPEILVLHRSSATARSPRSIFFEIRNRYWMVRHLFPRVRSVRLILRMMINDLGYAVYKRAFRSLLQAWLEGLGPMPPSLKKKLLSDRREFQSKLDELYDMFSLSATLRRGCKVIQKRKSYAACFEEIQQ